ncbi:MAG: hypothetical protein JJE22_06735 [Bacteroidia bacterium]|nr:hypothetical protein [Bacteroidia bacterium]
MKKLIFLSAFAFLIIAKVSGSPKVSFHHNSKVAARATFDSLWVDYDVTEEGVRGMRIHLKFTVYEMKDSDAYVAIFFLDDLDKRLKDKNDKFTSSGGDVALYQSIKARYDPADYNDLQLFMPYSELDLDPGNYNLAMEVNLIKPNGNLIQHLADHDFQFNKPEGNNDPPATAVTETASLEKVWVDYDITENGQKGMRIHVKFSVFNMKDVEADLAIYFEKKNGDKLTTTNTAYQAKNGQVAIYKSLKPAYNPESVYNDAQLFMPYKELNLPSGKYDLTMDIDVIYANGNLVKHLEFHDFTFQ